jgi:hypothetical protein
MPLGHADSSRIATSQAFLAMVLTAACSLSVAQSREPAGSSANVPTSSPTTNDRQQPAIPSSAGTTKPTERLREGTRLIDVTGTFQSIGNDSVSFSPGANKDSFRVLENLALERISRTLDENRGPRQWIVSGLITEYRGSNYLLVTKAVIQLQEGDSATSR